MKFKWIALIFSIAARYIFVTADDNNNLKEDKLKYEFGCIPVENWKLIKQHADDEFVKNTCKSNLYEVYESPSKHNLTLC